MTGHVGKDHADDLSQHTLLSMVICRLQARMHEIGHQTCRAEDKMAVDACPSIDAVLQKLRI
jgi:hypothetical protein